MIAEKDNYHVDEIYSSLLTNNSNSTTLNFEDGIPYTSADSTWLTRMVAEGHSRLNFENV